MNQARWAIYVLFDTNGNPEYIGQTVDVRRRMGEHAKRLGRKPTYEILERGTGVGADDAEKKWIASVIASGASLRNATEGGKNGRWTSEKSRRQLSEAVSGRPVTWGDKIATAQKGKPKKWSAEGARRVREAARRGTASLWASMTAEERSAFAKARISAYWEGLSAEQRSLAASERNRKAWAHRSVEERKAIGRKAANARRKNGTQVNNGHYERTEAQRRAVGEGTKAFWRRMSPEERQAYIKRRAEAIRAAKERKKNCAPPSSPKP